MAGQTRGTDCVEIVLSACRILCSHPLHLDVKIMLILVEPHPMLKSRLRQ